MKNIARLTLIFTVLSVPLTFFYTNVFSSQAINPYSKKSEVKYDDLIKNSIFKKNSVLTEKDEKEIEEVSIKEDKTKNDKVIKKELIYKKSFTEVPLASGDYYYGKYINASIAATELSEMPILKPGDRISIIGDNYLTFDKSKGYIKPSANIYYASGVCWTATTLGAFMDQANIEFTNKYGVPLFTFEQWDRYAHKNRYATYAGINYGYGYAVSKPPSGKVFDYKFTVNPEISNIDELKDLEIRIVMEGREDSPTGYRGQVIDGYILSNIDW